MDSKHHSISNDHTHRELIEDLTIRIHVEALALPAESAASSAIIKEEDLDVKMEDIDDKMEDSEDITSKPTSGGGKGGSIICFSYYIIGFSSSF